MLVPYTVPVPPKPKKPYYEFDVVAALHRDAAPEARALALLIVARELATFAHEMEFQKPQSAEAAQLREQADRHVKTALELMPK